MTFKDPRDASAKDVLRDLMRDISEDHWAAGWLSGLEFSLWRMVENGSRTFGMGIVPQYKVDALKKLSDECGGWWIWRDGADGEEFVTLAEFLPLYHIDEARADAERAKWDAGFIDCPKCKNRTLRHSFGITNTGWGDYDVCHAPSCDYSTNGAVFFREADLREIP